MMLFELSETQPPIYSVCVKKMSHGFEPLEPADIPQISWRSEPQFARLHPWKKSIRPMELQLSCHDDRTAGRLWSLPQAVARDEVQLPAL